MQRELKFRVWNHLEGKWNGLWYQEPTPCGEFICEKGLYIIPESVSRNHTIQQYTRMKDKNGKEIYEGDIIKYPYYETVGYHFKYFQVVWDDFFKAWALADDSGQPLSYTGWKFYNCDMGEVWGNIFENPELLKN